MANDVLRNENEIKYILYCVYRGKGKYGSVLLAITKVDVFWLHQMECMMTTQDSANTQKKKYVPHSAAEEPRSWRSSCPGDNCVGMKSQFLSFLGGCCHTSTSSGIVPPYLVMLSLWHTLLFPLLSILNCPWSSMMMYFLFAQYTWHMEAFY